MDLCFRCLVTIRYNEEILVWGGVRWIQSVEITHPYERTGRHWRRIEKGFAISNGSRVCWAPIIRSLSLVHANIRDSKTDRQAAYLSHMCVCDNMYIYTRYCCSTGHCTQFQYCECSCLSFSLPLFPSLIPHPPSIQPPFMPENHPFPHHPCSAKVEPIMPPAGQSAISLAASICTAEWVNFMFTISAESSVHPAIHDAQLCDGNLCSRISLL